MLLYSCVDEATKIRHQMEEFIGSTIRIPHEMNQINYSNKEDVHYSRKAVLLVVYIDSLTCATCYIKNMLHYDEIVNYRNDTISDYKSVFIFSPKKNQYEKVKDALMFSGLNSPAFLDEKGMFPAVNPHIPADDRFYTFLLDKNGKVVLVGNPVNNPQLWELYKTTITTLIENGGTMPDVEK